MNFTKTYTVAILFLEIVLLAGGCSRDDSQVTTENPSSETASENETPKLESVAGNFDESSREFNAAHILIMHKDSQGVPEGITRTKEEALAMAQKIATQAQANGADFAALARKHSDGPSRIDGGNLGNFLPEHMVPAFSRATAKLAIGGVSDPVETPFGYHIIHRQKLLPKVSAKHILVMHTGSMRAPADITRTKEEAETRIRECLAKYHQGEKFEDLASEYSDGPSSTAGGDLGEFTSGKMFPAFDKAVFACAVGKVTDVVETPFGYHIIYRYK